LRALLRATVLLFTDFFAALAGRRLPASTGEPLLRCAEVFAWRGAAA
jgi:hypothetical protein